MPKTNKTKTNKNKTNTNTNKTNTNTINDIDDKTFDKILSEFKTENIIEANSTTLKKTPLAEALDSKKKEDTKNKLRNAINMKTQMRNMPSKKMIDEQTDELKKMMKHPKMNQHILDLYGKAIAYDPKNKLPKPTDIFSNTEHFKAEYYQYILGLIKTMKEKNLPIVQLDHILDNPYGHYMSACIGCPLNPFNKIPSALNNPQPQCEEANCKETHCNKPQCDKSEAKSNQQEANQPEANQPEANQPEANQPEANQPESNQPESNQPEANQSEDDIKKMILDELSSNVSVSVTNTNTDINQTINV
jgi:hypothetical protein